ncbi:MAG: acyl carrier protein [Acidobacteriota bacterium]|nr:acyl carrier protein [Acidobacteriota bacterium]
MPEVSERIRQVLKESLKLNVADDELKEVKRVDDLLGLDSIALLEFVMGLEREFGVTFDPERLDSEFVSDLDGLARYVRERLGEPE